ncbi:hypothetical protein [Verticiella sediminum]|uniref:hypothetical protein n=1 Tax=Verticiella sediminum TaxID=1247510 RepID=UPI0014789C28|nr:hypothetical protein [Verticiella sediminum]
MTRQVPGPEDGDRPEGPMPDEPKQRPAEDAEKPERRSEPARPVFDHPEEQNSG